MGPVAQNKAALSALAVLLSACVEPSAQTPRGMAMTMPPPDGRAETVRLAPQSFVVNRQMRDAVSLRVTRLNGRDLDYSEGAMAKKAVEAYCARYNRSLDPAAMGRFSLPNSWIFGGDCL